jgi:IclR family pca regulon transcriptional regulator
MSVDLSIGSRLPAYCTALGRAFLAHIPDAALSAYLDAVTLAPLTPNTKTSPAALRGALQEVRVRGFALVDQELEMGFRSIAVPVFDARGQVVLAINISVPTARMGSAEIIEAFVPILLAAQQDLRGIV